MTQQGVFTSLTAGLVGNGTIACTFYPQLGTMGDGSFSYTGNSLEVYLRDIRLRVIY